MNEAEQAADEYMKRMKLTSKTVREAFMHGYCDGRQTENKNINRRIYEAIRKLLSGDATE